MTGPIRCAVIAGLLVGCGDDSSTPGDAAGAGGGLVVTWASDPDTPWPGDLGDGVTIERAMFAFDSLRLVGDAAPGDPRTSKRSFELVWENASAPADVGFPDAPGGVYSQLSILIDGHVAGPSIEWRGRARVNSVDYAYRITDDSPFSLTLSIDKTLRPPDVTTLGLEIDFDNVLDAINFDMLDETGGVLELDNADPQITVFRTALMDNVDVVF